ncbi:MAG: hypothetical protein A2580_06715 [Hydrogenophilales bacterium RIFOXYD1_FULL_62_11]|nr:MAG: hypothetical protein A2580_06715 [Hydrogenophilales bacterium RIFOXYD1_FULL_62_11]
MKSITAGESLQRQQAAAEQWVESSGAKLSHMLTEGVARKDGTTMSGGEMVAAGWSESQTAAFQNMINRMESEGTISEEDAAFARKMDQAQMARASVAASATVGTPLGGIVGSNASVTGKVEGAGTSTASESDTKTLSVAHSLQKAVQASDSESRAVQDVLTKSTQNFLNTSHSSSVEATDAESLSKAAEQSRVASQSYGDSVTRSSGISSTQSATFDQVEQNFHDRYGAGAQNEIDNLRSLAYGAGLGDDYETALRSHMSHGGLNSSQAEVAALFDTFNSATVTNDNADEIAKGMGTLTDTAFNNYSSGNVQARADLDGSTVREDVTAATRHVAGATSAAQTIDGPGLSAGDIRGDVAGGMSAAQTGIDNVSIEDPGADGKILPSESQGASAAAARQDVNDTYSRNEGVIDDKANDFISKSARVTVAGHHQE